MQLDHVHANGASTGATFWLSQALQDEEGVIVERFELGTLVEVGTVLQRQGMKAEALSQKGQRGIVRSFDVQPKQRSFFRRMDHVEALARRQFPRTLAFDPAEHPARA